MELVSAKQRNDRTSCKYLLKQTHTFDSECEIIGKIWGKMSFAAEPNWGENIFIAAKQQQTNQRCPIKNLWLHYNVTSDGVGEEEL